MIYSMHIHRELIELFTVMVYLHNQIKDTLKYNYSISTNAIQA